MTNPKVIRNRAARLLRENVEKFVMSAAEDMTRMGLSNIGQQIPEMRAMLKMYDEVMEQVDAIEREVPRNDYA